MARINTNIPSLIAQNRLARSSGDLTTRLQRLSTGLRINRGADDPAGLIVSERLRSELRGTRQAITNSERTSSVIATTEGYLAEVADLLNSIKGLIVESANTGAVSAEEIEANQLQIDSALDSITRIANTASFAGLKLLNGSLDYLTSGVPSSNIIDATVHGASFGNSPNIAVNVEVIASAQTAVLYLSGNQAGSPGALLSSVTLEVSGNLGVQTLVFASGTALSAVVAGVNNLRESTGVSAALVDAADQTSGLTLNSVGYGSNQFVSVRKLGASGAFFSMTDAPDGNVVTRDTGVDVTAVINGALAVGRGLEASLNTPALSVALVLSAAYATATGTQETFHITGGGAEFQLGPDINAVQRIGIGVRSTATSRLGGTTIAGIRHYLDSIKTGKNNSLVSGNKQNASAVLDSAITEISVLRGRLGAFELNTVQTNIRSLQIGVENLASSESKIRDADFAEETAALSRAQVLQQAGTAVLATANSLAQNVLQLLQ